MAFSAEARGTAPAGAPVARMRVARKAQAAQFAANILPIIREVQAAGYTQLQRHCRATQRADGRHRQRWPVEACAGTAGSVRLPVRDGRHQ